METKKCTKCGVEKKINEFHKDKTSKDGLKFRCIMCWKEYVDENADKLKKYRKDRYWNNLDDNTKRGKEYYRNNLEKNEEKKRRFKEKNPKYHIFYYQTRLKEKYKNDIMLKLTNNVRRRIRTFLHVRELSKKNKTFDIVGCTPMELKNHLENQFTNGMNWENYGFYGWHIDHKIPLDNGKTEDEILRLCHYSNLQPLWANENLSKGNKIKTDI